MLVSIPSAAHAQGDGLVAAYGFEEPSGSTAVDSAGSADTGTLNGASRVAAGRFGAALSFDGNDRVDVADSASLDLSTAMTLEAWVKPNSVSDWRTVVFKERPGSMAYTLYGADDAGRPMVEINAGAAMRDVRGTSPAPTGAWMHLATTYDGATLRLYVGGVQVGSRAVTGQIGISSGALRIGGNTIWGEYFDGLIDEVRVYNRALTAAEIVTDMGRSVVPSDTTAPSAPGTIGSTVTGYDVRLSWGPASDNVGVTGYRVSRDGELLATVTGTSFDDPDRPLTPSRSAWWRSTPPATRAQRASSSSRWSTRRRRPLPC